MKKKKNKSTAAHDQKDIVNLIHRDHKPLKKLIRILKKSEGTRAEKQPAFEAFAPALLSHAQAEEKSLYESMKKEGGLRMQALEGDTEHQIATTLINEINGVGDDNDHWLAKTKVLAESVEHHIKEEENVVLKDVTKNLEMRSRILIGEVYTKWLDSSPLDEAIDDLKSHFHNKKKYTHRGRVNGFIESTSGKVGVPILLYFLGVPGIFCVLIWAFFFKGP